MKKETQKSTRTFLSSSIVVSVLFLSILYLSSCGKKKDPSPDFGANASGTYRVTYIQADTLGVTDTNPNHKIIVTKKTTSTADISEVLGTTATIANVTLTDGGSGRINLSYSDASGKLTGYILNGYLEYSLFASNGTATIKAQK